MFRRALTEITTQRNRVKQDQPMKLKTLILAMLTTTSLAHVASAQTTVVNITGSSSFRRVAANSIRAMFSSGVQFGYTGTSFNDATQQIFVGNVSGITGTTIVRTFWGGQPEALATACLTS
jgi:hypothetical protein